MANYIGFTRTNYFRVTDENRYKELFLGLYADDDIHDFSYRDEKGILWHGFGSYDWIGYNPSVEDYDSEYSFDNFVLELMKILPENEAFIKLEIGYEKLRVISGMVVVATKHNYQVMNLEQWGTLKARELLNNPYFETRCSY